MYFARSEVEVGLSYHSINDNPITNKCNHVIQIGAKSQNLSAKKCQYAAPKSPGLCLPQCCPCAFAHYIPQISSSIPDSRSTACRFPLLIAATQRTHKVPVPDFCRRFEGGVEEGQGASGQCQAAAG